MNLFAVVPMVGIADEDRVGPGTPVAGRPLCDWAIRAALDSGCFQGVYGVVGDEESADLARALGAEALVVEEVPESLDDLLVVAAEQLPEYEGLALVDPLCPLQHPDDIRGAVAKLLFRRAAGSNPA